MSGLVCVVTELENVHVPLVGLNAPTLKSLGGLEKRSSGILPSDWDQKWKEITACIFTFSFIQPRHIEE